MTADSSGTKQAPATRSRARNRRWLRLSGTLSCVGLVVVLITFQWLHPLAFVSMLVLGGACVVGGVAGALFALLDHPVASTDGSAEHSSEP